MTDIVTPAPISPMPAAPLLTDTQAVFNTKAFAFVAAWDAFVAQMNAAAVATRTNGIASDERATIAQAGAAAAAASAIAAGGARDMAQAYAQSAVNAPGTRGTSATANVVGSGQKYYASEPGKGWVIGQAVVVARVSDPAGARMYGIVTDYNSSSGVIGIFTPPGAHRGAGTFSDWTISVTGTREGFVSQGTGVGQTPNAVHIGWSNDARLKVTVDTGDLGPVVFDSHLVEASPPGMFGLFFMSALPTGWLKCNGAAVSRTAYARLFAAIGTYYGAGDGSTTFNVPEMRGIFPRTWDDGRGVDPGRGFGTYQAPANISHNHGGVTHDAGWHNHSGVTDGAGAHGHTGTALSAGWHNHSMQQVRSAGGGGGANSLKSEDSAGSAINTSSAGEHTHALSLSVEGYHQHSLWIDGNGTHGHGINADGAGESRPHNMALMGCIRY